MRILVTGTPGVGKTHFSKAFIHRHPDYKYVNVSDMVYQHNLVLSYDSQFDSAIPDEEHLLDELEILIQRHRNIVVDHHSCDRFPVRWFDIVVLLKLNTEDLYDRLAARNYSAEKIRENIEVEIMGIIDEAVADFDQDRVLTFTLRTEEDTCRALEAMEGRLSGKPRSVRLDDRRNSVCAIGGRCKVRKRVRHCYSWIWNGSLSEFYSLYAAGRHRTGF